MERINARLLIAYGIAFALILGCYMWLGVRSNGAVSIVFLLILPWAAAAFVAAFGRNGRDWGWGSYILIPSVLTGGTVAGGAWFFREGVICIAMLAPLWWLMGLAGVYLVWLRRPREPAADVLKDTFRAEALLVVPLLALWIESTMPLPVAEHRVASSIIVDASPAALWPMLQSIPAVSRDEGRWTATHNLLQLPRPLDARLAGSGVGAVRHGQWQGGIRFQEVVTRWEPERAIHWRFHFPDRSLSNRVDRHLSATGPHSWVERGGYDIAVLPDGRTRVTLWTEYRIATHANGYAALWGEWLLGDIQNNILAVIEGRTSRDRTSAP